MLLNALLTLFSINSFSQSTQQRDTSLKLTPEIKNHFLKESKDHGKFDYWSPIKGHEFEGEKVALDLFVTKEDAAIIKWSFELTTSGLKQETDIISLYEDLKKRKITKTELAFIDYGYNKALQTSKN
jgi:hypothetical protein